MTKLARTFWGFVLRLIVVYGLLIAPWPGLKEEYGRLFRGGANLLISPLVFWGKVEFLPPPQPHPEWDVEMYMSVPPKPGGWKAEYSSRGWSYLPIAMTAALIVATPLPWRRRLGALLAGLLLIHFFVAIRVLITIVYGFYWKSGAPAGPVWDSLLEMILLAVSSSPVTSFLVPVLVWAVVSLRREDFERLWEPN